MSFEILEYPLKLWVIKLIDDEKDKSDIFDLLGESNISLKYPSNILETKSVKHCLTVKIREIERNEQYVFDLKSFKSSRKVSEQLIGIMNDASKVLGLIIKSIDQEMIKKYDLDKLYVMICDNLKIRLCYEGDRDDIKKNIGQLSYLGYQTTIDYPDDNSDEDDEDDEQIIKNILNELTKKL